MEINKWERSQRRRLNAASLKKDSLCTSQNKHECHFVILTSFFLSFVRLCKSTFATEQNTIDSHGNEGRNTRQKLKQISYF